ncbi:MAG TPA: 50S ribosomal protein L6 [Candidatus Paceibacterota bacterium]
MSRIGKKPIVIPEKTQVTANAGTVAVKGPLGELTRVFRTDIAIVVENGTVVLKPTRKSLELDALWGTYSSHIANMIEGVNKAFEKKLIVEGIGFKADVKGKDLVMSLGFSHPVKLAIPEGLKVTTEKNTITASGMDIEKVGQFVARVRAQKKPEPYKGKGIRYDKEVIRRKEGKKAA